MDNQQKNGIQLQNANGVTIFSMNEIETSSVASIPIENDIEQKIKTMISPMLSAAPNIAKNIQQIKSYEAVFSPKMKKLLDNGTAVIHKDKQGELLPQIIHTGTDGKKGQIIKKVRLKSGMTPANVALLGWQVASMITAQKHLSDINHKLETISKDVKDIKKFLEDELFAQIESRILATKNLMICISKNTDFFQEFKDFHAAQMSANMEKTDELIRRIENILNQKIESFSREEFKESSIEKTVQKYKSKLQEITPFINTSLQLIETQHILCTIYAFYSENNTYADTWRESLQIHQRNLKQKIDKLEELAKEKSKTLDYSMPLWEIGLASVAIPLSIPFVAANEILAKFDVTDSIFDGDTAEQKARKIQYKETTQSFDKLNQNISSLFKNMEQQANSVNAEHRVVIDLDNGRVVNIKLLT